MLEVGYFGLLLVIYSGVPPNRHVFIASDPNGRITHQVIPAAKIVYQVVGAEHIYNLRSQVASGWKRLILPSRQVDFVILD
jgi:hypothetical protein